MEKAPGFLNLNCIIRIQFKKRNKEKKQKILFCSKIENLKMNSSMNNKLFQYIALEEVSSTILRKKMKHTKHKMKQEPILQHMKNSAQK